MTIKSATPSGSQRARAPASGDERPWFKADIDAWAIVRDLLPRPWPARLCAMDLRYMEARERFCRTSRDGQTVLQARWGLSATAVKKHLRAFAALSDDGSVPMGCPEGAHGVPMGCPSDPHQHEVIGDEVPMGCPEGAHGVPMGCPSDPHQHEVIGDEVPMGCPEGAHGVPMGCPEPVENAQQTLILEAPKSESESESKNTIKPAKAGGVSLEDIQAMLDEMHAIAKAVEPRARRQSAEELAPAVLRTLKDLAPLAKSRKTTTRALIIDIWQWWWNGDNPWYRENRRAGVGYTTLFRPANARKYLTESQGWQDARYIPTADEALDAVLEVGCGAAEQRYPAGAKAIRQTYDYAMGGDLARMRAPKDPAKMRAAWSAGFTKYLSAPALALVSR